MPSFTGLILALWLALASSLPAVGGLLGPVLCFSSQGHIAFEASHVAPKCADFCDPASLSDDTDQIGSEVDPHSCFDITLRRLDFRAHRIRTAMLPSRVDLSLVPALALGPLRYSGLDDHLASPQRASVPLERARYTGLHALGTVILLI